MKSTRLKIKPPSLLKKVVVVLCLFGLFFGSLLLFIINLYDLQNYYSPYIFFFICLLLAIIVGIPFFKYLKPFFVLNTKMFLNYEVVILIGVIGLFGLFVHTINLLNKKTASIKVCDDARVESLYHYVKKKQKDFDRYYLFVNIDGASERIQCSFRNWDTIHIGMKVRVCKYKSKLGFDYIELK